LEKFFEELTSLFPPFPFFTSCLLFSVHVTSDFPECWSRVQTQVQTSENCVVPHSFSWSIQNKHFLVHLNKMKQICQGLYCERWQCSQKGKLNQDLNHAILIISSDILYSFDFANQISKLQVQDCFHSQMPLTFISCLNV